MSEIIDFTFNILTLLWSLITQYWFLSFSVIIALLNLVITIIIGTSEDK